jgi:hypothetical protein
MVRNTMNPVPMSGTYPDVSKLTPFKLEKHDGFNLAYFQDIKPIGPRNGGQSVVSYPFVLAVSHDKSESIVYFVTAEIGMMFGTSKLCGFDAFGQHNNFGNWPKDADAARFIEVSRKNAMDFIKSSQAATTERIETDTIIETLPPNVQEEEQLDQSNGGKYSSGLMALYIMAERGGSVDQFFVDPLFLQMPEADQSYIRKFHAERVKANADGFSSKGQFPGSGRKDYWAGLWAFIFIAVLYLTVFYK